MADRTDPLVSIVMPAYNAEQYIAEAIRSVLAQTWTNWELLVVNDGSTDRTAQIIATFNDLRIRVFHKANGGIGSARNLALDNLRGGFMCGLDADDVLPRRSIAARMKIFEQHPDTDIVDGRVLFMDKDLRATVRTFEPDYEGDPFHDLVALTGRSFMGFSWLVRWQPGIKLRFTQDTSHGEDLIFYFGYSPGKMYRHTEETVLLYRRTGHTVMSDLDGLNEAYLYMGGWLADQGVASTKELRLFHRRTRMTMIASYLERGKLLGAIRSVCDRRRTTLRR